MTTMMIQFQPLPNPSRNLLRRLILPVGIIQPIPRRTTLAVPQLFIQDIDPRPGLLRHARHLLQQVAQILDVLGLLAQEPRLHRILQGRVAAPLGERAEPLDVFQQALLHQQGLLGRLDGLDGVIGPFDVGGLDGCGLGATTAGDEVIFPTSACR